MAVSQLESDFLDAYIETGRVAESARIAGCADQAARHTGYRILQRVHVRQELERRRAILREKTQISQEMMIDALRPILFSNIGQFADWTAAGVVLFDAELIDDEAKEAIAEVSSSPSKYGVTVRVKLHDKLAAWEKVARMLGFFKERSTLDELISALTAIDPELGGAFRDAIVERRKLQRGRARDSGDAPDQPSQG